MNTADRPFYSIIVPAFNAEAYLDATIATVRAQTFADWELIVVDDGSTDRTAQIVERHSANDGRISLIRQHNQRQAAARNTGIRASTGAWIAFLDADDLWAPEKLAVQHATILSDPSLDVVLCDGYSYFENRKGRVPYHWQVLVGKHYGPDILSAELFGNSVPNLAVVMKREWVERVGYLDDDPMVAGSEDHEYWLRLMAGGATFYGDTRRLFIYRVRADSFSSDAARQQSSATVVRMKYLDNPRISPEAQQKLRREIQVVSRQLYVDGHRQTSLRLDAHAGSLGQRTAWRERVQRVSLRYRGGIRRKPAALLAAVARRLVAYVYMRARWRAERVHRALHTPYLMKKFREQLAVRDSLNVDPTAIIAITDVRGRMDVDSLYVGDCTRVNVIGPHAHFTVGKGVHIGRFCNFNVVGTVILGDNTLFNNFCSVNCHSQVTVGRDTWFGEGVRLYDHNHRFRADGIPFVAQGYNDRNIDIGANVWVGANCVILLGVTIGDGAVIGANNVIYKSVPANTIVKARGMENMQPIERERFLDDAQPGSLPG